MTVGELKELLEEYNDTDVVLLAREDDECAPVQTVTEGFYFSEDEWSSDFVSADEADEDPDINVNSAQPAIVLWGD